MTEIMEVFEEFGDNAKSLFKNKKFWLLAGGVGAAALVAGYLKNKEAGETVTAYDAVGYAGYPTIGGASSTEEVSSDVSYIQQLLQDSQTEYDAVITEMEDNITTLSNRLTTSEESNAEYQARLERQNAISQMRANSELYNSLGEGHAATKEALHAENLAIAEKYGFTFDPASGNYFEGNTAVYTTAKQQATLAGKSGSTVKNTAVKYTTNSQHTAAKVEQAASYDPNKDYTTAIREAKSSGASESVIKQLYAERNAKIADNPELKQYQNDV